MMLRKRKKTAYFYFHDKAGFTFLEVMVVMVILTMAFVSAIPNIEGFFNSANANRSNILNTILADAYKKAIASDKPVMIWGVKDSDTIHMGGKSYKLKNGIFSAVVNGTNQEGIKYYFFVYPSGIMDSVQIMFSNDERFESEPLLLDFKST
ncbi:MAG: hypothetical protein IEMM0003_0741 [bacterium]|nr:MAG: hypothetical protein IEMM0003_0741 [bacterium]